MKKLNVIIASAFCASLMAVSASAASNECVSVFDRIERINAVVNGVNISNCSPQSVLQSIISGCFDGQLPTFPEIPDVNPESPEQEQKPILPEPPEQEELPDNDNSGENVQGSVSVFERRVVELVNAERAEAGLAALKINEKLSSVAREKSADMQRNGYFSHTSPTYGSPFDMLRKFGISYNTAGENIAMGYSSTETVVNGWMNSAGHRANILSSAFTEIGVGHVANGNYWTQLFIG